MPWINNTLLHFTQDINVLIHHICDKNLELTIIGCLKQSSISLKRLQVWLYVECMGITVLRNEVAMKHKCHWYIWIMFLSRILVHRYDKFTDVEIMEFWTHKFTNVKIMKFWTPMKLFMILEHINVIALGSVWVLD